MSSSYFGNANNLPTGITVPSDGDVPIQASDVNPALEGVFDGLKSITNSPGAHPLIAGFVDTTHLMNLNGAVQQVSSAGAWLQEILLPNRTLLNSVVLHLTGAGGHNATLTGLTKPTVTVLVIDPIAGTSTPIAAVGGTGTNNGTITDPSTTNTQYDAIHTITVNFTATQTMSRGVGNSKRYVIITTGEAGTNYQAGLVYWGYTWS